MNRESRESEAGKLPVDHNEDVEYSEALADEDDREAAERAEAADQRQEG
ncbi:YfhD family protein [Paenibacillus sp. CC-CFT747]|nr:YfhD family protein [Paenibacillus sp. CC-CFT747]